LEDLVDIRGKCWKPPKKKSRKNKESEQTKKGQKIPTIFFDCPYWLWLTASGARRLLGPPRARGWGGTGPQRTNSHLKKIKEKNLKEKTVWVEVLSPPTANHGTKLDF